jgi:protein pelota
MKLSGSSKSLGSIDQLGEDGVRLIATEPEDMWHANNLIAIGDVVRASTIRRVNYESESTTRPISKRVHTELTIQVIKTFFDPIVSQLQVSGVVAADNEWVATGLHHTLDLELNRPFTLWKREGWDSVAVEELKNALQADNTGEAIAAVVMQEGRANICLITDYRTVLKQSVDGAGPAKGSGAAGKATSIRSFFEKVLSTMLRAVDFQSPRPLLLASPGFVAQNFRQYIADMGAQKGDKMLQRIARDAVIVNSSSGHVYALNEVLRSSAVQATMKAKKFSGETKAMDELFESLARDDGRAWYGVKPVELAVRDGAVGRGGGVLLVNNSLFRSMDVAIRKRYVALVDKVRADGGVARILSADHESGQRLAAIGGVAAILTYPMLDLDEGSEEEEQQEEEVNGHVEGDERRI